MNQSSDYYREKCEEYRQRLYSLNLMLNNKVANTEYLRGDVEIAKQEVEKKKKVLLAKTQLEYREKISALNDEKDLLQCKIQELSDKKEKLMINVERLKQNSKKSVEEHKGEFEMEKIKVLKKFIVEANNYHDKLKSEIRMKQKEEEMLQEENTELDQRLNQLGILVEHKQEIICQLKDLIVVTRNKISDMRNKLDNYRFKKVDVNRKGNSLFSEIEDRKNFLKQRTASLKLACERIKQEIDMNNTCFKQTLNQMKVWSLTLTDPRIADERKMQFQQQIKRGRKYLEKISDIKKIHSDIIVFFVKANKTEDEEMSRERLEFLRLQVDEGQKRLSRERFWLTLRKDTLKNIIEECKQSKLNLETEKRKTQSTSAKTLENRAKIFEDAKENKQIKADQINKTKVRFDESSIEKNKSTSTDKTNKTEKKIPKTKKIVKCQSVNIGEPVLESCNQQ